MPGKSKVTSIHVGIKRIAKEVKFFVEQTRDSTQQRSIIYVIGSPKSGKTTEARIIIPHLLEPRISEVILMEAQLPCHKVYIDCTPLESCNTLAWKLWRFYLILCEALKVSVPANLTESNITTSHLANLFRKLTHYTIITVDEYQMLVANLPEVDRAEIATTLRNVMLDETSICQFIVTGSTSAAVMSSLTDSIQNGISVFKSAGIVETDLNSSADALADVATLLTHLNLNSSQSTEPVIRNKLGFVNCAILNVISSKMCD
jgi:hypothetical protein